MHIFSKFIYSRQHNYKNIKTAPNTCHTCDSELYIQSGITPFMINISAPHRSLSLQMYMYIYTVDFSMCYIKCSAQSSPCSFHHIPILKARKTTVQQLFLKAHGSPESVHICNTEKKTSNRHYLKRHTFNTVKFNIKNAFDKQDVAGSTSLFPQVLKTRCLRYNKFFKIFCKM